MGHAVNMASTTKPATASQAGQGPLASIRPTAEVYTVTVKPTATVIAVAQLAIASAKGTSSALTAHKRKLKKGKLMMQPPTQLCLATQVRRIDM